MRERRTGDLKKRVPLYLPALRGFMEIAEHFVLVGQVGVMLQRLLRNVICGISRGAHEQVSEWRRGSGRCSGSWSSSTLRPGQLSPPSLCTSSRGRCDSASSLRGKDVSAADGAFLLHNVARARKGLDR